MSTPPTMEKMIEEMSQLSDKQLTMLVVATLTEILSELRKANGFLSNINDHAWTGAEAVQAIRRNG